MATSEAIPLSPPVEAIGGGNALGPVQRPVRREQFLHRVGSSAWLLTVERVLGEDGTEKSRTRIAPWPGL